MQAEKIVLLSLKFKLTSINVGLSRISPKLNGESYNLQCARIYRHA